jgi:hypothetical protein
MIRERELIAQLTYLKRQGAADLDRGRVIVPHRDEEGCLFDQVDESRVALACDLHYRMGLDHASLPVIMSLTLVAATPMPGSALVDINAFHGCDPIRGAPRAAAIAAAI